LILRTSPFYKAKSVPTFKNYKLIININQLHRFRQTKPTQQAFTFTRYHRPIPFCHDYSYSSNSHNKSLNRYSICHR